MGVEGQKAYANKLSIFIDHLADAAYSASDAFENAGENAESWMTANVAKGF
jgi:hypothetical protein